MPEDFDTRPELSREDFVRNLRRKAEAAAEASVHHATLSQQYMMLSTKLATLAEQAATLNVNQLQEHLSLLERSVSSEAQPHLSAYNNAEHPASAIQRDFNAAVSSGLSPTTIARNASDVPDNGDSSTDHSETPLHRDATSNAVDGPLPASAESFGKKTRRSGRQQTRQFVSRVRSAKLAIAKRIPVKAKKSDLKPKQRLAIDELRKSRHSIATSTVLFVLTLFVMNLITWQLEMEVPLDPIVASFATETAPVEPAMPIEPPEPETGQQMEQETETPTEEPEPPTPEPIPENETPQESKPEEASTSETSETPLEPTMESVPTETTNNTDASKPETPAGESAAANSRSAAGRKALLQKYGGSQASESAVQKALDWLMSVQHPQGWWDFVNTGESGHAGTVNNPIGATAYALLPFLAAGQTHTEGNYQKQVGAALTYLTRIGVNAPAGYDLRGMINKQSDDKDPNEAYYVHGAATLALCEALSMTNDRRLRRPAEGAVRFLLNSQDPKGGGWRYSPQEAGSTSVTAIQVMALMAAKKAGITVPDANLQKVHQYLDSVQVDGEGRYGYEVDKKTYKGSVTAMALLCRMYLGWGRDSGDLRAGVALLDKAGPYDNLYTTYFATQVMKNWGGAEWERWNARVRDDLIAEQETEGPAQGSWKPRTGAIHAKQGGRLLSTVLAALTLQVYYRYEPLLPEANPLTESEGMN